MTTKTEKIHLSRLAEMGCAVCGSAPAEIHHLRAGVGMGQKSPHKRAIGLCASHHRLGGYGVAIHAGQRGFEERFGTEELLLERVISRLMVEYPGHKLPE